MKDILLPVAHVFSLVMMVFAATMLAPLVMAVWALDPALSSFVISALATFALGALLWLGTRRFKRELKTRDGLMLVALTWVALPAVAGFPLWNFLPIDFTHAYFEAASGLTTTGGTVLSGLEFLPRSINLWRHLLSWLGGMGIIVLAVAILPLLGVGGMQLYRAGAPGTVKDAKLAPRITETARTLGYVYAGWPAAARYPDVLALQSPFAFGYVSLIGAILVIPTSLLTAPLGVRAAHAMSKTTLERAFGFYLLVVGSRFAVSLL